MTTTIEKMARAIHEQQEKDLPLGSLRLDWFSLKTATQDAIRRQARAALHAYVDAEHDRLRTERLMGRPS